MGGKSTDTDPVLFDRYTAKLRDAADIDQRPWMREAHFQHRDEAVPTRKQLGVIVLIQ
jgi:hypothetical protein